MQDVFGNYVRGFAPPHTLVVCLTVSQVVQKLLEHGTQVQRNMVAGVMDGHIMALSLHMYACRVVQKVRGSTVVTRPVLTWDRRVGY